MIIPAICITKPLFVIPQASQSVQEMAFQRVQFQKFPGGGGGVIPPDHHKILCLQHSLPLVSSMDHPGTLKMLPKILIIGTESIYLPFTDMKWVDLASEIGFACCFA